MVVMGRLYSTATNYAYAKYFKVPFNSWYCLQITTSDTSYYAHLADNNGNLQYFSQVVSYGNPPIPSSGNTITIGNNFRGYIKSLRYYKT